MAMVFGGRVGTGRLLVCTLDVLGCLSRGRPEAAHLLWLLIGYARSPSFNPAADLTAWGFAKEMQ